MEKHDWIVSDTRLQCLFMMKAIPHLDIVHRSREKVLYFIILHLMVQWLICLLLLTPQNAGAIEQYGYRDKTPWIEMQLLLLKKPR